MRKKTLILCLAGILASFLATSVWAVPPCSYIGYSDCNATCQFLGEGGCSSWSFGACQSQSRPYTYVCTSGFSFGGWCSGCTSGGGGCFLAGTQITMADGSTKAIENIRVADVILAYDQATGEMKPDKVVGVHDPVVEDHYLVVNGNLRVTPTHPVLSNGEFTLIGKLQPGDSMTSADGSKVVIDSIERVDEQVTVYNFAVNPYETYVANGIIVHNRKPDIEDGSPP